MVFWVITRILGRCQSEAMRRYRFLQMVFARPFRYHRMVLRLRIWVTTHLQESVLLSKPRQGLRHRQSRQFSALTQSQEAVSRDN